ncbi:MAG: S41 family peptidase [Prosthecobacter sp.]
MRRRPLLPLTLSLFITSTLLAASRGTGAESKDVSQAGIQTAFRILQREYIRSNDLTFDELNRAALAGLLQRLDFGAELIPRKLESVPDGLKGVQMELLTPQVAYLRPQAFTERETTEMEQSLRQFSQDKVAHVILDLRTPSPPGDFDDAAAMLSLFVPKGEVLFKMKQMGQSRAEPESSPREPVWTQRLLVLVDEDTNNLGETIAAVLRQRKQALLIGSATRGGAVRYETVPVDANWSLRFARAEVLLADDSSVFKKGLQPDFVIGLSTAIKRLVFEQSREKGVKSTITDKPRARFNEAALMANTNPELDAYIRRSAGEPLSGDATRSSDTVLQRALDLLTTRDHLRAAKIDWKNKAPAPAELPVRKAIPVKP